MKNHKWQDNTCIKCGLKRERREYKKAGLPYGVLSHGVWEDRIPYTYGMGWYYGADHKFNRPYCQISK